MRAQPIPDALTEPFWAAAKRRQLVVQRCRSCRRWQHPPRPTCVACGTDEVEFSPVSGNGTVVTWSEVRHPFVTGWTEPFTCFLVELVEQAGLLFVSDDVRLRCQGRRLEPTAAMPMRVEFEPIDNGLLLPQFVPTART